jgi:CBS domain-containing protein
MIVEEVMSCGVTTIDADDPIQLAAERMRGVVIGALPVLSHGKLVGMVTDRDLAVRATARGLDARAAQVREVMTAGAITCLPGESVEEAVALMRRHGVRRLVVVDRSLEPVGLLSIDDLALRPETRGLAGELLTHVIALRSVELDGLLGPTPPRERPPPVDDEPARSSSR